MTKVEHLTVTELNQLSKICDTYYNIKTDSCTNCPILNKLGWCPTDNLTFCGNNYSEDNRKEFTEFLKKYNGGEDFERENKTH